MKNSTSAAIDFVSAFCTRSEKAVMRSKLCWFGDVISSTWSCWVQGRFACPDCAGQEELLAEFSYFSLKRQMQQQELRFIYYGWLSVLQRHFCPLHPHRKAVLLIKDFFFLFKSPSRFLFLPLIQVVSMFVFRSLTFSKGLKDDFWETELWLQISDSASSVVLQSEKSKELIFPYSAHRSCQDVSISQYIMPFIPPVLFDLGYSFSLLEQFSRSQANAA